MATMLRGNQSTEAHLNAVRRHMRLCGMGRSGEGLVAAIKPFYDDLSQKRQASEAKSDERQDALDTVILMEGELDDAVRTAHERCLQYDRQSNGRPVLFDVFPDGKFGPVIALDRSAKLDAVEQLAARIGSLGDQHPLFSAVAELRLRVETSRKMADQHRAAVTNQKKTEAEEEISRFALRRQYETNYLNARAACGKAVADRLFPRVAQRATAAEREDTPQVA